MANVAFFDLEKEGFFSLVTPTGINVLPARAIGNLGGASSQIDFSVPSLIFEVIWFSAPQN